MVSAPRRSSDMCGAAQCFVVHTSPRIGDIG